MNRISTVDFVTPRVEWGGWVGKGSPEKLGLEGREKLHWVPVFPVNYFKTGLMASEF